MLPKLRKKRLFWLDGRRGGGDHRANSWRDRSSRRIAQEQILGVKMSKGQTCDPIWLEKGVYKGEKGQSLDDDLIEMVIQL